MAGGARTCGEVQAQLCCPETAEAVSLWEGVCGTGRGVTATRGLEQSCCETSAPGWEL